LRIDLHRHLEGSHSARALLQVGRDFGLRHPLLYSSAEGRWRTLDELRPSLQMAGPTDDPFVFYECIQRARVAYVSEEAICALSALAFREAAADAPDGLEMRVSLFSMTRTLFENEGLTKAQVLALSADRFAARCRGVLGQVLGARDAAEASTGVPMRVRLGFSRTFESEALYEAMAEMAAEFKGALCGLDILGIVSGDDREPLQPALLRILEGLRRHIPDLTVHAGEFEGHGSVDRTLALEPQGVGHGVHAVQSATTLEALARAGVTLEVCPTSNHLLIPRALSALRRSTGVHPLVALQRAKVHAVLGSDDPTPMGCSYTAERELARAEGVDLGLLDADTARRWAQLPRPARRAGAAF
jgi:adenosine deaminase